MLVARDTDGGHTLHNEAQVVQKGAEEGDDAARADVQGAAHRLAVDLRLGAVVALGACAGRGRGQMPQPDAAAVGGFGGEARLQAGHDGRGLGGRVAFASHRWVVAIFKKIQLLKGLG